MATTTNVAVISPVVPAATDTIVLNRAGSWITTTVSRMVQPLYTATDAATVNLDLLNGRMQIVTLGGNRALTVSNDWDGVSFTLIVRQDGTGSRTITSYFAGATMVWPGGTAPTLTTVANRYDILSFVRLSSGLYIGMPVLNLY